MIGAAALAGLGVSRATADLDLLALDVTCLDDIDQLLDVDASIAASVEREIDALPRDASELWRRIRELRGERR